MESSEASVVGRASTTATTGANSVAFYDSSPTSAINYPPPMPTSSYRKFEYSARGGYQLTEDERKTLAGISQIAGSLGVNTPDQMISGDVLVGPPGSVGVGRQSSSAGKLEDIGGASR